MVFMRGNGVGYGQFIHLLTKYHGVRSVLSLSVLVGSPGRYAVVCSGLVNNGPSCTDTVGEVQ